MYVLLLEAMNNINLKEQIICTALFCILIYFRAKKYGASVPTVILTKFDDNIQPYVKFDDKFTPQNLQAFVDNNKLPKLVK